MQRETKEMAAKNKLQIAPLDDVKIIGINAPLTDYKMAWNINQKLCIGLTRYDDICLGGNAYSFYYYTAGDYCNVYDLVSLSHNEKTWIRLTPHVDFLFIIRNEISDERLETTIRNLRETKNVAHAFLLDITKNFDPFLETIEMHEISIMKMLSPRRKLSELREEIIRKRNKERGLPESQTPFGITLHTNQQSDGR